MAYISVEPSQSAWTYSKLTKDFEGLRLRPYKCTAGKTTIGYGRNLDDVGISEEEADALFAVDFKKAIAGAEQLCKDYCINIEDMSPGRFYVLTDMVFNLGYAGTKKFKTMLKELSCGDYEGTAQAMKDSLWYRQTGRRAEKLVDIMLKGE